MPASKRRGPNSTTRKPVSRRSTSGPGSGPATVRVTASHPNYRLKEHDFGNNESRVTGIGHDQDGFTALTLSESKRFKTLKGAIEWLARRGYSPTGERLR